MKVRWRRILLGIATALAMVAALEGVARVVELFVPTGIVDISLGFDPASRLYTPSPADPSLRETAPEKRTAFRHETFAARKPPGLRRVFVLGESSVFNLQPLFPALAERLAARLAHPVEILDAGGNSYGSARLVPIAREILDYDPDVVVLYLGHNEFEELEQLELVPPLAGGVRAASHLALFRLARDAIAALHRDRLVEQHRRVLQSANPDSVRAWRHQFTPEDAAARMRAFRQNVTTMVELLRSHGIAVVIGSIPSNLWRPALPLELERFQDELRRLRERGEFTASAELARSVLRQTPNRHQSSDLENEILRTVARRYDLPLADVESAVIAAEPHRVPGETLFADHCHLNDEGNKVWMSSVEEKLLAALSR